jgi:hypothetical protein
MAITDGKLRKLAEMEAVLTVLWTTADDAVPWTYDSVVKALSADPYEWAKAVVPVAESYEDKNCDGLLQELNYLATSYEGFAERVLELVNVEIEEGE